MNFHRPLLFHKSEWERLKKQTEPPTEKPVKYNVDYLKELIEKSQEWIKAWPDSVEGRIRKLREQEKIQHEKYMALITEKKKGKIKTFRAEAVKKAKKMIFEDSCYGKQLISAFIESKTLEERDAQVQFQKKIRNDAIEKSTTNSSSYCTFNLDKNHEKKLEHNKLCALQCTKENKWMQEQKEKHAEHLLKQQNEETKPLLIDKNNIEDEITKEYQKSLKEYEVKQQTFKEQRKKQDELDDAIIKLYQKEQNNRKCKIQKVFNKIHKDKQETTQYRHVYKIIEDSLETQNKRYQFIDERIKSTEQQDLIKDAEEANKAEFKRKTLQTVSQFNQNIQKNQDVCSYKYICDKQCLIPTAKEDTRKKTRYCVNRDHANSKLKFLKPKSKLANELKQRAKEPPAWSGTEAAHEHFALVADQTLQECVYKNVARKVVDNYRRLHNLNSTSLPVPNY
ncbi:hypothetical protein O3G_MSEX007123 [Manduca sexta]|uniref:Uncharacterized protein n=1 Tax=Manduca sexta TaxID=7130 RepID=A0A921Z748_MANSE|nr:hypothetical protein O3G_MSEX007123 [Manduca sexta]